MRSLLLALAFFTRIPMRPLDWGDDGLAKATRMLPLVGLLAGLVLAAVWLLLSGIGARSKPLLFAVLLLVAYLAFTGGLHLDGLADSCDGIFSGRDRERSLEIMKDSMIGSFGTLALICAALLYVAGFTAAPLAAVIAAPAVGRSAALVSQQLAPPARPSGLAVQAGNDGRGANAGAWGWALLSILGACLIGFSIQCCVMAVSELWNGGMAGAGGLGAATAFIAQAGDAAALKQLASLLAAAALSVLACVGLTAAFKRQLGGITGDTLGATIEICSLVFLTATALAAGAL